MVRRRSVRFTASLVVAAELVLVSAHAADSETSAPTEGASPASPASSAEDPAAVETEARAAFEEGVEALRAERWADAESAFRRSIDRAPRASSLYNLAFALYAEKKLDECMAVLNRLLQTPDGAEYHELGKTLLVRVVADLPPKQEPAAEKAPVSPPPHATRSAAPERPAPREEPSFWRTTAPWITVGLGGALLAGGAVTGIIAKSKDSEVVASCPSGKDCDPSVRAGERDTIRTLGVAATVLLISGGTILAGGVTWRLVVPASPRAKQDAFLLTAIGTF